MEKLKDGQVTPGVKSAISQDRLPDTEKSKLNPLLTCLICQGILWKPIKCENCENYFCTSCISEYTKQHKNNCICEKKFTSFKPDKLVMFLLSISISE